MDDENPKALMLFDGDCGICTSFATFAGKIDLKKQFEIIPYQTYPEEKLKSWGTSYKQCSEKMQVVTPQSRTYSGAFGMNYFFYQFLPWKFLIILFYAIPLFLLLEIIGYALVARNRHLISKWFGLKACLRS
jgi:predicted DCC family thiol-disulfide oxidoreductase YuxK